LRTGSQYHALSRQLPMMYFILITSSWAVAMAFLWHAPAWLTVGIPAALTLGCAIRVVHWWRSRRIEPTPEFAHRVLTRTNRLASVIAIAFTSWSLMLFEYGDAYTRSYLAFCSLRGRGSRPSSPSPSTWRWSRLACWSS
jgi:predicted signal transduction protein with EAL and GGDEF domain